MLWRYDCIMKDFIFDYIFKRLSPRAIDTVVVTKSITP